MPPVVVVCKIVQAPPNDVIIAGKYRLTRKLGQGGMGAVWLAEHLSLKSYVAIKLIDLENVTNPEALSRFLREAQSAASLRSPHVVQIMDHGVDNGTPYIVMELLEGESLADRLTRLGRLQPAETARVLTHIARAIGRAHEAGIVHRDLKPDNVFLVRNDDEELAKVLDFGIAKSTAGGLEAAATSATRTGAVLGTPYYMSPEQAEGAKTVDHRTDIWAMGVIAFECLMGGRPFEAETLASLLVDICARPIPIPSQRGPVLPGFDAWFARACERDLNQRFASAKEAAAALKQVCDARATSTGAYSALSSASGAVSGSRSAGQVALSQPGGAVAGQSDAGFSSTNVGTSPIVPVKSNPGAVAALAVVGAVFLGGAFVAWSHFKTGAAPSASASAVGVAASAPTLQPEVAHVADVPTPVVASESPPAPPPSVEPVASAQAATPSTPQQRKHAAAVAVPAKPAPAKPALTPVRAAPAAPQPASGNKVNLGI